MNLAQQFRRRGSFKIFLSIALVAILFGRPAVWAILVEGLMRDNFMKLL